MSTDEAMSATPLVPLQEATDDSESVDPILWEDKSEKEMLVMLMSRLDKIEAARVRENQEIRDEVRKLREEMTAGREELEKCRKVFEENMENRLGTIEEEKNSQVQREGVIEQQEKVREVEEERMVIDEEPEDTGRTNLTKNVKKRKADRIEEVDPLSESYENVFIKEEVEDEEEDEEGTERRGFGGLAEIFLKMEDNSSSDELISCPPAEQREESSGKNGGDDSLPPKSKVQYESAYNTFSYWKKKSGKRSSSETVLMAYFEELSKKWKPSTLWSTYSMLKSTINIKEKINIGEYPLLTAFLKKQSAGFHSKKSSVFTAEDIQRYLNEAPDIDFLATKVGLIFGVCGACRSNELVNVRLQDITKQGNLILVNLPITKTKKPRTFVIGQEFTNLVRKYEGLRPRTTSDRFFLNYQKGRCTAQVIGVHKFSIMPKQIATFLGLANPETYTGHAFRRTATTLLTGSGANIITLKRHRGLKSSTVTKGFRDDSEQNRMRIVGTRSSSSTSMFSLPSISSESTNDLLDQCSLLKRQNMG